MKVCSKCHIKKAGRHYSHDAGGVPHQMCKKCEAAAAALTSAQRRERAEPEAELPTEATSEVVAIAEFALAAGWPASVKLLPDWFHIVQEREDEDDGQTYRHEVKLLPSQARQLMDRIGKLLEQHEKAA